jgi:hypothetical protein
MVPCAWCPQSSMWWPQVTLSLVPADCEVRDAARLYSGINVDGTTVSLQRCLLADNPGVGIYVRESGSARLEGCEFMRNRYDTYVTASSSLFTDKPASAVSTGCNNCDATTTYGPILTLASAPAASFLSGEDAAFVELQLVRFSTCHTFIFTPAFFIVIY